MLSLTLSFTVESAADLAAELNRLSVMAAEGLFGLSAGRSTAFQTTPTAVAALDIDPPEKTDAPKRGRRKAEPADAPAEPPAAEKPPVTVAEIVDAKKAKKNGSGLVRDDIIRDLTAVYQAADQSVKDQIVAWRNERGVTRLRDLKDDQMADAATLLQELSGP